MRNLNRSEQKNYSKHHISFYIDPIAFDRDVLSCLDLDDHICLARGNHSCLDQKLFDIEKGIHNFIQGQKIPLKEGGIAEAVNTIYIRLCNLQDEDHHFADQGQCKSPFAAQLDKLHNCAKILSELFSSHPEIRPFASSISLKRYLIQTNSTRGQRLRQIQLLIEDIAMIIIHSLRLCYLKGMRCIKKAQILIINRKLTTLRKKSQKPISPCELNNKLLGKVKAKKMRCVRDLNALNEIVDRVAASRSARFLGQKAVAKQMNIFSIIKQIVVLQKRAEKIQNPRTFQKTDGDLPTDLLKLSRQIDLLTSCLHESMRDLGPMRRLLAQGIEKSGPLCGVGETLMSVFECGLDVLE